ncbi:PmoA family protein [candidate division KSB1 bacterium]|nr:PmoA family protein [candidate division KSB1 bacterium]
MKRSLRFILFFSLIFIIAGISGCGNQQQQQQSTVTGIELVREGANSVKVYVNGQHFTTYAQDPTGQKPIFFPVVSSGGNMINRGWPMIEGLPDEKTDHKHHQSLWFTYGEVNGADFWGEECGPERNGKIVTTDLEMLEKQPGFIAHADWIMPDKSIVLKEEKKVVFLAKENVRIMDFTIKLTAGEKEVHFDDTKEGMFGFRATPSLKDDNDGQYINSDSLIGKDQCWGKRAAWLALAGPVKDETVTVVIFTHPETVNFPPYWHARGYGLTSANPFGRKAYTNGEEPALDHHIKPGESLLFKARFMVYSGELTKSQLDQEFQQYTSAAK